MWQAISERVQNPLWWFDALFPVIIGIVLTTLVWPTVTRWIAKYSDWYRSQKAATLARQEIHLKLLVSNPELLMAHNFRAVVWVLMFMTSLGILVFIRIFVELTYLGDSPYYKGDNTARSTGFRAFLVGAGLVNMYLGYKSALYVGIVGRAYRTLLRKHMAKFREENQRGVHGQDCLTEDDHGTEGLHQEDSR